jgi:hypothetical protein
LTIAHASNRFTVDEPQEAALVRLTQKLAANADRIPPGVTGPIVKPRSIDDVWRKSWRATPSPRRMPPVTFQSETSGAQPAVTIAVAKRKGTIGRTDPVAGQ